MNANIKRALRGVCRFGLRRFLSDKPYLKVRYRLEMGRKLDLRNPETMNEKLQWLKLNNRYAGMSEIVDKIKVKDIVAEKIGPEYVIPTLAVWNNADDINVSALPERFVVKTNHSGGNLGVFVCKDKNGLDLNLLKSRMRRSLKDDIYWNFAEWPYKNVVPTIFAEECIADNPVDYKFYCFNGEVDSVMLCLDRETGHPKFYFFNKDWNLCRYNKLGKAAPEGFTIPKPEGMDRMFEIASKLSEGHPFLRVDLYNVEGRIYFGEMTFYPAGGFDGNRLRETDLYFGSKIDLSLARHEVD